MPLEAVVPAAGQGALMVLSREDGEAAELLASVDDAHSRLELLAEKSFVKIVGGGCRAPVGAYAHLGPSGMEMVAAVVDAERGVLVRASAAADVSFEGDAEALAEALAQKFAEAGGLEALARWKEVLGGVDAAPGD